MSSDTEKIVAAAKSYLTNRVREDDGANRDKAGIIASFWRGSDLPNGAERRAPYCMAFVGHLWRVLGAEDLRTVSCSRFKTIADGGGGRSFSAEFLGPSAIPMAGDAVLVDTGQPGLYNHVGIVINVTAGRLTTIEANTSSSGQDRTNDPSSSLDGVHQRTRYVSRPPVSGYVRVRLRSGNAMKTAPQDQVEMFVHLLCMEKKRERVEGFQILINAVGLDPLKVDGVFGPATDVAARKIYGSLYPVSRYA